MDIKQVAIDKLANSMRMYIEVHMQFSSLKRIDLEEAINNLDRAFETKLEAFHSLYDVTKHDFNYFKEGDTALLIMIRNAIHHRKHNLFHSWNKRMFNEGVNNHAGATYLFIHNRVCDRPPRMKYLYKLEDIFLRLDDKLESSGLITKINRDKREDLLRVISDTLQLEEILEYIKSERFPIDQVYINLIPIFISAVAKVFTTLKSNGVEFIGFDSKTYEEPFTNELSVDYSQRDYESMKIPEYL